MNPWSLAMFLIGLFIGFAVGVIYCYVASILARSTL